MSAQKLEMVSCEWACPKHHLISANENLRNTYNLNHVMLTLKATPGEYINREKGRNMCNEKNACKTVLSSKSLG